jgi:hypothetical protein
MVNSAQTRLALTCTVTLWPFRVTAVALAIEQRILCVLLSCTSLSTIQKYRVLLSSASVKNLRRQPQ